MEYEATQLEKKHVHSVYESTAPYFNEVQSKAWPKVRQFLLEQKPGSLIVDIGCGTGKYLSVNSEIYNLGCDYCEPLVEIAKNNQLEVMVCDNLNLPFRDQCFDTVISIGVIHHFSTKQRRIRAINEMARILLPGGQIMLYVWAMEQKNRRFEKQDVFVPWNKALMSRRPSDNNHLESKMNPDYNTKLQNMSPKQGLRAETIHINNFRQTMESEQSNNTCNIIPTENCCIRVPNEDNRLYNAIGRSIRSWFFSRSLDESSLKRQIEKMKSLNPIDGWMKSTVSVQPSRHCSLDLGHQRLLLKDPSLDDDDVFIKSDSNKKDQWFFALNSSQNENGRFHRIVQNDSKEASYHSIANYSSCIYNNETDKSTNGKVLQRTSTTESNDSILDETVAVGDTETDILDTNAYMRYYHVFRDGELCNILETEVPELKIISSCYDHGNWCIIAEKL